MCPLTPDDTGNYSDLAFALDTHAAAAGQSSIFDEASDLVTKAIPLTGIAIANSFLNTGVAVDNFFGGDAKKFTPADYTDDSDTLDYYNRHSQGIEAAGLIVGSLLPGLAAVKALKLAQAGIFSDSVKAATGLFSGPKKSIVDGALNAILNPETSTVASITADKMKAVALGFGDQALQALVYETATDATMHGSPLLDQQGLTDTVSNIIWGGIAGGAIGGVVEGATTLWAFKKAQLAAGKVMAPAQYLERLGDKTASFLTGDKALTILNAVDKIPDSLAGTTAGTAKAAANRQSSIMDAKIALQAITPDPQIASDMIDATLRAKASGVSTEDLYTGTFGRLARVDRATVDTPGPDTSKIYFNRFAKNAGADFSQLVTSTPEADAKFSQAYQLAPNLAPGDLKVGNFGETVDFEGTSTLRFQSSEDAWNAGMDVFINNKLQPLVNPNSPNILKVPKPGESRVLSQAEETTYRATGQLPPGAKPLLGGQVKFGEKLQTGADASNANQPEYMNLATGAKSSTFTPVVGDYGTPQLVGSTLRYGENSYKFDLSLPSTPETPTIEANARFVAAALREVKRGDAISSSDIPMMEQLYRQTLKAPDLSKWLEENKVTITGPGGPPTSSADLLSSLKQEKNDLLAKLVVANPKMGADELALHANVPQKYLSDGMVGATEKDLLVDPVASYGKANTVKLWYDIGNIHADSDGMILKGAIDAQYRINLIKDTVQTNLADFSAKYLGDPDFGKLILQGSSSDATPLGVKPGFATSTSADYNSLGQQAERTGKAVGLAAIQRMGVVNNQLFPAVNALRDAADTAGADTNMFIAVRQRTNQQFKFLSPELQAKYFPDLMTSQPGARVAVLRDSLTTDAKTGLATDWNKDFLPDGFIDGSSSTTGTKGSYNYYTLPKASADWETANAGINAQRIVTRNNLRAANGLSPLNADPDTLYTPPIDTAKYRFMALVKQVAGKGGTDDSVGTIVAQSQEELDAKIASLPTDQFSVFTKSMVGKYHEVLGDYENARNFADNKVNSELSRRGILSDFYPDARVDTTIQNYIDWHARSELQLIRDHVESGNSQLFTELKAMQEQITPSTFGSAKGPLDSSFKPYTSYIDTALGKKQNENYKLWSAANEKVEAFFDTAFSTARNGFEAAFRNPQVPFSAAVAAAKKYGLGDVYGDATSALQNYSNLANKLPPQRYLSNFLSQASSAMNYTVIRLDAWQQLVHALSTPILLNAELSSATKGVKDLLTVTLPGTTTQVPGVAKIFFNSIANLFDNSVKEKWLPVYKSIGALRDPESELIHRNLQDAMALPFGRAWTQEGLAAQGAKIVHLASKLSNWTEFVTSFMTADAARQLFEAKGYTGRELLDNIGSFVNRVKGNTVASQRPVAFQGPIGQAVGLFQTYQFNMMQNIFRYVGERDGKSLAIAAGMQGSLFGFSSMPGFQMMNSHIIGNASGNTGHEDIYSTVPGYFGKQIGDYLLFGAASNLLNASLYTRGDMNPRNLTLLPVNPLNFPAIAGGIRLYSSLAQMASRIAQGGDPSASILLGLEHNGLSRPLAGMAQLAQGFSTTSNGELQSAAWPSPAHNALGDNTSGLNDLYNAGVFSRLLGARPLDEAVAMDAAYRGGLYRAKDTARIASLGEAVKTTMYGGKSPSSEEVANFASEYAKAGGRIGEFGSHMIEWTGKANSSVANSVFSHLQTPLSQQMMKIMGGVPLPDFRRQGSTSTSGTVATSGE